MTTKELTIQPQNSIERAQMEILTQSTPADEIRYRKGRGNREFPYTDTAYVIRTLNLAFNWNWDFVVDNEDVFYVPSTGSGQARPFEVKCRGRLTVRMEGKEVTKTQFGCQPIELLQDKETPVSVGDAFKGAASDALKKCASLLGIALDLYDSDSDINRGKRPASPVTAPQPTAVQAPRVGAEKKGNGHGKLADDPTTQFWAAVGEAEISKQEGKRILDGEGGDAVKALNALKGISQVTPGEAA